MCCRWKSRCFPASSPRVVPEIEYVQCVRGARWYECMEYYNTLQLKRVTLQCTAAHCNTLQHTATHCNALQRTATHCNTLQHGGMRAWSNHACVAVDNLAARNVGSTYIPPCIRAPACCSVLQCVTVCCSVLQRLWVHGARTFPIHTCPRVLQCVAACCSVLRCVAAGMSVWSTYVSPYICAPVCCSVLQCVAVCDSML